MDPARAPEGPIPSAELYERLRASARRHLAGERVDHTLQPTALVHEAWLRLVKRELDPDADPRAFALAAADAMRRVLIDHARGRARLKRGGDRRRVPLDALLAAESGDLDGIVAVDEGLRRLQEVHPRTAELVRLRFFCGLEEAEAAQALSISPRTARREWAFARAWLFQALGETGDAAPTDA